MGKNIIWGKNLCFNSMNEPICESCYENINKKIDKNTTNEINSLRTNNLKDKKEIWIKMKNKDWKAELNGLGYFNLIMWCVGFITLLVFVVFMFFNFAIGTYNFVNKYEIVETDKYMLKDDCYGHFKNSNISLPSNCTKSMSEMQNESGNYTNQFCFFVTGYQFDPCLSILLEHYDTLKEAENEAISFNILIVNRIYRIFFNGKHIEDIPSN